MAEVAVLSSIDAVPAADWNALAHPGIERHAYLRAVERSGMNGFLWRYIVVREGARILAAAPAFVTDYAIETTLGPDHAQLATTLRRFLPRVMTQRMAALGSPCTETATIGFAADLAIEHRYAATTLLLDGLERLRRESGATLTAAKDIAGTDRIALGARLSSRGWRRMPGLPTASLPIDFDTIEEYITRLSPGTRRDMRRKLRARAQVRVEQVRDIAPMLDRIMALYRQTRDRAEMTFEELTPGFFVNTLREAGDRAFMTLYWHGDQLAAANLLLEDDGLLLDKFFCMDAALGRPLNLYYLSWFENLAYCLRRHLVRYQAGQAAYASKLRLGCRLEPTEIWFRHRNPLLNGLLKAAAPLLAPASDDLAA